MIKNIISFCFLFFSIGLYSSHAKNNDVKIQYCTQDSFDREAGLMDVSHGKKVYDDDDAMKLKPRDLVAQYAKIAEKEEEQERRRNIQNLKAATVDPRVYIDFDTSRIPSDNSDVVFDEIKQVLSIGTSSALQKYLHGKDLSQRLDFDQSPLYLAIMLHKPYAIPLLIAAHAPTNILNEDSESFYDLAVSRGYHDVAEEFCRSVQEKQEKEDSESLSLQSSRNSPASPSRSLPASPSRFSPVRSLFARFSPATFK